MPKANSNRNREELIAEIYALRRALKKAHMILASHGIPNVPIGWGTSFAEQPVTGKKKKSYK